MTKALPAPGGSGPQKDKRWAARGHIRFGLFCVLILVGGFGGWAAMAKLAGAVVASGQLKVEVERQVVQHPDGGIVGEILVREGDFVEGGEVLVRLDGTQTRSELSALESQLYEIMAREGRLVAEQTSSDTIDFDDELLARAKEDEDIASLVQGQRDLFHARRETMERELEVTGERQAQIREQIEGARAEIEALNEQIGFIQSELTDVRDLNEKGLARRDRLMSLEREAARLRGQLGQRKSEVAQLKGQISELESEMIRMRSTRIEEAITQFREIGFRKFELMEERVRLREQLRRLEITAPRSGVVYDMRVHAIKSVIRPADPIMFIVPTDSGMIVEARVNPIDIDNVHIGQDANLRFSAFSARTTPELAGVVVNVSADSFTDEQTGQAYYNAEISIPEEELEKLQGLELVAGMPVEAFIQTGRRTPIEYLLKPMSDYLSRAMRES